MGSEVACELAVPVPEDLSEPRGSERRGDAVFDDGPLRGSVGLAEEVRMAPPRHFVLKAVGRVVGLRQVAAHRSHVSRQAVDRFPVPQGPRLADDPHRQPRGEQASERPGTAVPVEDTPYGLGDEAAVRDAHLKVPSGTAGG